MTRIIFLISLMFLITGCSVFQGSRKINMSPFSDNAETMFGEAVKISRPFQWKHLKTYTSIPEFKKMYLESIPLLEALRGIVYYSNQVVAINNAQISDKEKNRQLALYLYEALQKAKEELRVDSLRLDESGVQRVLEDIRNAKKYLDGLAAATPIINTAVVSIQDRIDNIEDDIPLILVAIDREIEKDYGTIRRTFIEMKVLQNETMRLMTRLYRGQMGNTAELDTLLQLDASLKKFFTSGSTASQTQLAAAEAHLAGRLQQIDIMFKQLEDDKMEYIAKQDELVAWRIQVDEKIKIARSAMSVWAQSHRNLGSGIPVPPMIDVAGFATGLVGSAAKTVIP